MKPYRVEYTFTEEGYSIIVAETPELATAGILKLLTKRGIKNPVVTAVVTDEEEQLELPFPSNLN